MATQSILAYSDVLRTAAEHTLIDEMSRQVIDETSTRVKAARTRSAAPRPEEDAEQRAHPWFTLDGSFHRC